VAEDALKHAMSHESSLLFFYYHLRRALAELCLSCELEEIPIGNVGR
jgi:hypothetical protein